MENSIYLGLSKQTALFKDLDIVSNNIANMNTPGYRAQNMVFEEFISDPRGTDDPLTFPLDAGQYDNTQAGSISFTGNPLDVSLEGDGFFGVQGPGGETVFTRAGNFQLNSNGDLMTAQGFLVADSGGATINIPRDATEIKIDEKGFISTQNGTVGQLMVNEFANPQALEPIGNNLYRSPNDPGAASLETRVKQGQLEGSNVKPVIEMTRMIKVSRSFQAMQNVLQTEGDRLRTAIQRLTRQS